MAFLLRTTLLLFFGHRVGYVLHVHGRIACETILVRTFSSSKFLSKGPGNVEPRS